MKLKNVPYYTWVSYKGRPHHTRYLVGEMTGLWTTNQDIIEVTADEDVNLIEVPTFNIGDSVLYTGTYEDYQNKIVTITAIKTSSYRPYQINNHINATPFDLISIKY